MGKRIEFDEAARTALRRGVDQLAGAVRVTLGPRGRNVVIDARSGAPTITNDGLTIAREIELENPFENMGAQLLKEVALKTGEVAGDGTTTATVLAQALVGRGLQAIAAGHHPMAVRRGIERAVEAAVAELRRQSQQVTNRDDIRRVATISANDDPDLGALIADAVERVGRQGVVTVEEGRGMATTLEVVEGVRFQRGYLSPYFITDPSSMEVAHDNAVVVLTDFKLTAAGELVQVLEEAARLGRPVLVVADDIEGEALAIMVVNRLRGTVASVGVRCPDTGDRRRALLEDLALLTGARTYTAELGRSLEQFSAADFGRAKRVVVDRDTTTLIEGAGRPAAIREQIAQLEHEIETSDTDYDRDWLRERIARLGGGIAVIRVGAPTETEMAERKARVGDALAATRAAIEEGVVTGGGVALIRCAGAVRALEVTGDESVGRDIVLAALEEPARQIAENAGMEGPLAVARIRAGEGAFGFDAVTGQFGDLVRAGIVDPTKVVRCALQNAASIGSLVLTTDAIVVDAPDEPEAPEEDEGPPDDE